MNQGVSTSGRIRNYKEKLNKLVKEAAMKDQETYTRNIAQNVEKAAETNNIKELEIRNITTRIQYEIKNNG